MSQCSVPPASTGPFGNRLISCSSTPSLATRAAITRPREAPRSTPATITPLFTPVPAPASVRASTLRVSSQERLRHARVDRDEQPGGEGQVAAGQREDRRGDVLREHLFLQQRALGVERAELLLGDAVDGGALRAPAAGEDAGAADHAVRVDAVDADADRAE